MLRRSDHPHHATRLAWVEQALADAAAGRSFALQPTVAASFLRLVTNSKAFVAPTPIDAALNFIDAILGSPGVEMQQLGSEWHLLCGLCIDNKLVANDIPDA